VPDAVALGLVAAKGAARELVAANKAEHPRPLARDAAAFHRFALEQLAAHLTKEGMKPLLGLTSATTNRFSDGEAGDVRESTALATSVDLDPPEKPEIQRRTRDIEGEPPAQWLFCDALRAALQKTSRARAWRDSSKKYEPITQTRAPRAPLPPLLSLHCATEKTEWASDGEAWVPSVLEVALDGDGLEVFQPFKGGWAGSGSVDAPEDTARYELAAVVSHVASGGSEQLVAHAKVRGGVASSRRASRKRRHK